MSKCKRRRRRGKKLRNGFFHPRSGNDKLLPIDLHSIAVFKGKKMYRKEEKNCYCSS